MFRSPRLLALLAGTTLAVSAFAGTAGAAGPVVGPDEITNNPCAGNPDLPACQGDDDPDPGIDVPDLDWCFSLDIADCSNADEPEPPADDDDIPSADPADSVTSSPNFTG